MITHVAPSRPATGVFPHRPTLAIDIDGVLAEVKDTFDNLTRQYTGQPWPIEWFSRGEDPSRAPIPLPLVERIYTDFHEQCLPTLPLKPGARAALSFLQPYYRLIIVTARRPSSATLTQDWLSHHRLPYEALYFASTKPEIPEPIAIAIDDHPRHITAYLNQNIRSLLMTYPWNTWITPHPLLTPVTSWKDVLTTLLPPPHLTRA